jgi:hypothetical protein
LRDLGHRRCRLRRLAGDSDLPLDFSDLYQVKGESFLALLADACGVPHTMMEDVFAAERAEEPTLVGFLKERFDMSRLRDEGGTQRLARYLKYIQPKP